MKITKQELKRLIKEEILKEAGPMDQISSDPRYREGGRSAAKSKGKKKLQAPRGRITQDEVDRRIKRVFPRGSSDLDNEGQIIVYTELYYHNDGSIRSTPDPNFEQYGPNDD